MAQRGVLIAVVSSLVLCFNSLRRHFLLAFSAQSLSFFPFLFFFLSFSCLYHFTFTLRSLFLFHLFILLFHFSFFLSFFLPFIHSLFHSIFLSSFLSFSLSFFLSFFHSFIHSLIQNKRRTNCLKTDTCFSISTSSGL